MTSEVKNKNVSYYINSAIVVALMFLVPFIEPFGMITENGMRVLGVFLGMLWGWLTVGFVWPSLLGLILIGFSGLTTISAALGTGFGNVNLVICTMLGFMFGAYLDKCDLTGAIAAFFMTRKFISGKPYVLVGLVFALAFVLGSVANAFAGVFITWAILYKVIDLCEYERNSLKVTYLLAMVLFAAVCGSIFVPFHAITIMYTGLVASVIGGAIGQSISYMNWMLFQFVVTALLMLSYIAVGKYIFKFDFSLMANTEHFAYMKEKTKLNFEQKFGLVDLILVISILILPEFLPDGSTLDTVLKSMGVWGAFLFGIMLPVFYRDKDGQSLVTIKDCMDGVSWDVIWMLIATGPVSAAMQSADSGIVVTIVTAVTSAFSDMSWISFTLITAFLLGLLTQVTHNVIIAVVLFGPLATVCQQLGGNPTVWFIINFWMNMSAFMTPAASVYSAILFGNTEWVDNKSCYLTSTVWFILNYVVVCVVGFTLGSILL